ncbi:MAG TPA: hypothetical protein VF789_29445 [Thermoanaerobaculia bacterium]
MWIVEKIETRSHEMDFSTSGQARHATTSLIADGIEIVNALDLLDLTENAGESIQLIVCDCCGYPGCNSGDRVAFRRLEDGLLFIPSFDAMLRGRWEADEYVPPSFISKKGAPFFRGPALDALSSHLPIVRDLSHSPILKAREAALLLQWEAPAKVLGEFPSGPRLRRDLILTDTRAEMLQTLDRLLAEALGSELPVSLIGGETVTFYIDQEQAAYPEWEPLVLVDGGYRLALARGQGILFG